MALGQFTLNIQKWVDKTQGNIDLVVRKIALDMFRQIVIMSPVDTGRFRANWQVAIGSIPTGVLGLNDKSGTATISRITATTLGLKAGQIITLVNNLAYARRLEYGYSKQAPNGMVRLTAARFGAFVNQAAQAVPK